MGLFGKKKKDDKKNDWVDRTIKKRQIKSRSGGNSSGWRSPRNKNKNTENCKNLGIKILTGHKKKNTNKSIFYNHISFFTFYNCAVTKIFFK